jgi:hypothetical protein
MLRFSFTSKHVRVVAAEVEYSSIKEHQQQLIIIYIRSLYFLLEQRQSTNIQYIERKIWGLLTGGVGLSDY